MKRTVPLSALDLIHWSTMFFFTLRVASDTESLSPMKDLSERIPAPSLEPGRADPPVLSLSPEHNRKLQGDIFSSEPTPPNPTLLFFLHYYGMERICAATVKYFIFFHSFHFEKLAKSPPSPPHKKTKSYYEYITRGNVCYLVTC